MPLCLEEDQSRSYFFCSFQITPLPRAGPVTTTYTVIGYVGLMERGRMVPDSLLVPKTPVSFEELELSGHRNILVKQLRLFPGRHRPGTSIQDFQEAAHSLNFTESLSNWKLTAYMWLGSYGFFKPTWPRILSTISFKIIRLLKQR